MRLIRSRQFTNGTFVNGDEKIAGADPKVGEVPAAPNC